MENGSVKKYFLCPNLHTLVSTRCGTEFIQYCIMNNSELPGGEQKSQLLWILLIFE